MRPSRETQTNHSHTPIYDALYSEYRRSFRALPGDRTGEEELGFTAFTTGMHHGHTGFWRSANHTNHTNTADNSATNGNGRQHTGNRFPAALPPAPRRGF